MQTINCDLWVMETQAFRQLQVLSSNMTATGLRVDDETARAVTEAKPRTQSKTAIIPIHGALEARPTFLGMMFGMVSYERIGQVFDAVMKDDAYNCVVLDISSPGGQVYGCSELANKIFSARGSKPILAMCDPMAASGAYWIAAAADRVIVTPSGDVGSVGVISEHIDLSKALEQDGTKVTVIRSSSSPYKQEANPAEALTDEAKANQQARVDAIYERFVGDLARFRGVSVDHINQKFGKGRVVASGTALSAKMVDRIDTMAGLLSKLGDGRYKIGTTAMEDNWNVPTVKEQRMGLVAKFTQAAEATALEQN